MNLEQFQTQDTQTLDTSTLFPDITSQLTDMMAPFFLISIILSIVFVVMYIASALRKRKVERAILDIQKVLHEMNDRDKARKSPYTPPGIPPRNTDVIAAKAPDEPNTDKTSVESSDA